jgi:Domain of unknown function (DUF4440)
MRLSVLVIAWFALAQPLYAQGASVDSAAIVALELELTRLLADGRVDEYATHLTPDYARTTRQGTLERRDAALASWRAHAAGGLMRPGELWVRVYGDAAVLTGVVAGADARAPRTRITKTFVRSQGRWLLAALHSSDAAQR